MCPSSCLSFCVSSSPPALQNGPGTSLPRPACRTAYGHGPCSIGQVSTCTRILLTNIYIYTYICKRRITFQNLPNPCRGALWLPIWLPISYCKATAIWRPRERESAPCLFKFFVLPFCSSNCMLFQLTIPQKIAARRLSGSHDVWTRTKFAWPMLSFAHKFLKHFFHGSALGHWGEQKANENCIII